jgi:hypothetical protein
MNHAELKAKALSNPETFAAYESMDIEFSILRQMLAAREKAACPNFILTTQPWLRGLGIVDR